MKPRQPRPRHILFILTDDQGPWALGCAGNEEIRTPRLDALAASGVRLDNFFCTSPVCSPARASIMTGTMPSQHGIHDWLKRGNYTVPEQHPLRKDFWFAKVDDANIDYLHGRPCYTDYLAAVGYTCGLSGKWHLGNSGVPQHGFSFWDVIPWGGSGYMDAAMFKDGELRIEPGYLTDVITDKALGFLDSRQGNDDPFYLSVHYNAPHTPWDHANHPEELTGLYRDCAFTTCPEYPRPHPWMVNGCSFGAGAQRHELLSGYFGAISGVDRNVGRLIDKLAAMQVLDDTLIVFTSDNGMNTGHHGCWGKGNATFPQNMYEESVKVPFIVSCPAVIPGGRVESRLLSQYDLLPTLLDFAGIEQPDSAALPGQSFLPLLHGDTMPGEEQVVIYDEYGPTRMIRTREWKYVHRYAFGPHELYDLAHDPGEERNLVDDAAYQPRVQELRATLHEWFLRYTDPDLDGSKLPVTGSGQTQQVGRRGKGETAFASHLRYVLDWQGTLGEQVPEGFYGRRG